MYYLAVWFILAFSATYNYVRNDNYARIMGVICYLTLVFTAGLRYETGTDYFAYVDIFNDIASLSEFSPSDTFIEPLYGLLNFIFAKCGLSINIMFLCISCVSIAVLLNSFKFYVGQKYYLFAVILYYGITYFLLDMSGIRQAIALTCFIYSIRYIYEKKLLRFILLIAFAFCFHRSAAVLLLVYPLVRYRMKSWVHYLIFGIGLTLIVFNIGWLQWAIGIGVGIFLSGPMAGKMAAFANDEFFSVARTITPGLMIYVPIYIIAVWRRKNLEMLTPYFNILLNLCLLFMVALFYLYESKDISIRFSSYFTPAFVMVFSLSLRLIKQNKKNLVIGFFIILFVSVFAMRYMIIGNEPTTIMYRPYQNYLMYKMDMVKSDAQQRYNNIGN